MMQASRMVEEILVLNQQSMDEQTVLDWRPFQQGSTLGDILADHHQSCQKAISANTPVKYVDCIEDQMPHFSPGYTSLPRGEYPAIAENEIPIFKLDRTKMVILDWEALSNRHDILEQLLASVSRQKHFIRLVLLAPQLSPDFSELFFESFLITNLDICQKKYDLEEIFRSYCQALGDVWWGVARNPFITPCQGSLYGEPQVHPRHGHFIDSGCSEGDIIRRVYQEYQNIVPELVVRARDEVLVNHLPPRLSRNLGRLAAVQEFLLLLAIEQNCSQLESSTSMKTSTEALRWPLSDIPVERSFDLLRLQETELLLLQLSCHQQPTPLEAEMLSEIGFVGQLTAVILFDRPNVWEMITPLTEFVTVQSFRATLPTWEMTSDTETVGLNEAAFGINIEESFSRSLDEKR
jgi:hypothetical protein